MRDYWNKGIMTRCLNNVLVFGFKNMELNRIEARTMVDNYASQRLLEKTGFKKEGVQRGYRIIRGKSTDVILYGIVKDEYKGFLS
jgi:[ribosomal protein S5]-alanine N-acetyltransferase